MKLARLCRKSPREIADRGRQELLKRLDRVRPLAAREPSPLDVFHQLAADPELAAIRGWADAGDLEGAARTLFARWSAAVPGRFFEGAVSPETPARLEQVMPEARARLLAAADSVCEGRFDLLGYRAVSFGDPVDWHLDPISGRRAPLVHWSRLDPLDVEQVGDSKVVWELNRHQWLVRLGQAYRLTGAERYADHFASSVGSWRRANPRGVGINWASSLEAAFRIIAWSWSLVLFRGSRALGPELFVDMLAAVHAHAVHVERFLSRYFSPNTHLTGEALGLVYAGLMFPELRRARRWRALGQRILLDESQRQVLGDGVHFELSTCYQRYTAEIYLHFLLLSSLNAVSLPADTAARLQRVMDVLLCVRQPDGSIPQVGDADGGCVVPLAVREPDDARGLFGVAAALFGRADFAWAADGLTPEALWLLGPAGTQTSTELRPRPPESAASRLLAEGGYAVMRSGWDRRAHQLIFDVGPLGCPVSSGHGHADLLSIQCAVFGEPYLVDPGTFVYTADREWRNFFRGTGAHSTVRVDGLDQAEPRGPFSWAARPRARVRHWSSGETLDVVEAEHTAYGHLAGTVRHRRRVLWVKPRYWIIVDDLLGGGEHHLEARFQFAPIEVTVTPDLWARGRGAGGGALLLRAFAAVPLKAEVRCGEPAPIEGWVSPDYGQRCPAPALVYSAVTTLPVRIATLLWPSAEPRAVPPRVSAVMGNGLQPVALTFEDRGETVRFADAAELESSGARSVIRAANGPAPSALTLA
jgi:hypothetical protein